MNHALGRDPFGWGIRETSLRVLLSLTVRPRRLIQSTARAGIRMLRRTNINRRLRTSNACSLASTTTPMRPSTA
jgi:hypothetical protein